MRMTKQPNILLIMADQQRSDSLGCYGSEEAHTPNLDKLAKEGVLFENCYVNNPVCTPSRASIFTGKPLPGHGVYKLHDVLREEEVLFPKRLQQEGYHTALFGKLHAGARVVEGVQRHPNDGFDIYENALDPYAGLGNENILNGSYTKWLKDNHPEFYENLRKNGRKTRNFPKEVHFTHWVAERTIDYIRNRKKDQPFFCCMSLFDPHDPYIDYPLEMLGAIDENTIREPIRKKGEIQFKPDDIQREHLHSYIGDYNQYTDEQIRKMKLGYYASVAFLDEEIGRVIKELEKENLTDETMIIFVSDHGDMLGDHELLVKGAYFYDACTKVPLILRLPRKEQAGLRVKSLVQPHDIAATVLKQAGINSEELDKFMPDSIDLLQMIQDLDAKKKRAYAICMYRNSGVSDNKYPYDPPIHATMIRSEKFKLNVYHNLTNDGIFQGELFNMEKDPYEFTNLWDDPEYAVAKNHLLLQMINWMVKNDVIYNGSPKGEVFPDKSQWSLNNAL